jgi:hypothetical protein
MKRLYRQMTRLCLIICIIFFRSGVIAQTANYFIGSKYFNEVATIVKPVSATTTILAGYTYLHTSGSNVLDADMLLTCVQNGNVLWSKKWGNPGNSNDMIQDVEIAANGNIIAISIEGGEYYGTTNKAMGIYRIDQYTGNILYQNRFETWATGGNYGGDEMTGVCELPNGNIVVVGTHNPDPAYNLQQGIVVTYCPTLTFIAKELQDLATSPPNIFKDVIVDAFQSDKNYVYIVGGYYDQANAVWEGMTVNYAPPADKDAWGNVVTCPTSPGFMPSLPGRFLNNGIFPLHDGNMTNLIFTEIQPISDRYQPYLISGRLSDDCCGLSNSEQVVFLGNSIGQPFAVASVKNGKALSNTSRVVLESFTRDPDVSHYSFNFFTTENPDASFNDPVLTGSAAVIDGTISHYSATYVPGFPPNWFNTTIDYSRKGSFTTGFYYPNSFLDVAYDPIGMLYAAGATNDQNNIGGTDMYLAVSTTGFNDIIHDHAYCEHQKDDITINNPPNYPLYVLLPPGLPQAVHQLDNMIPVDAELAIKKNCGEATSPCGTVKISSLWTGSTGHGSICNFDISAVVIPGAGWSVSAYTWTGTPPAPIGYSILTPGVNTNTWSGVSIPNSLSAVIYLTVDLVNAAGEFCELTETITITCDANGVGHRETNNPETSSIKDMPLTIYPNPAYDHITIKGGTEGINRVSITDIAGKQVKDVKYSNVAETIVPLDGLSTGTYFIQINNKINRIITKTN